MSESLKHRALARRYSEALYGLLDEPARKTFMEEGLSFIQASEESEDVKSFLKDGTLAPESKAKILLQVFPMSVKNQAVGHFLQLLAERRREEILPTFFQVFEEQVLAAQGKARCYLSTATPLNTDVQKDLETLLSKRVNKKLVVSATTNPRMLGGFRAEVDGIVIDASTQSRLEALKRHVIAAVNAAVDGQMT